ncbi:MAG: hypothetical protein F2881_06165, partial [Actinobacteria bacterium]|nr:hypothetical protein [Actinomycetota bacterium]
MSSRWTAVTVALAMAVAGLVGLAAPASAVPTKTVTISNIPAINGMVGSTFTPTYSGTFTGTASVSSSTTSVCSVASGVVTFLAAGTCTLTASATDPATGSAQSITVGTQKVFDGLNGPVNAQATDADGVTYVGGNFTGYGPQTSGAVFPAAGGAAAPTLDRTIAAVNGTIYASAPDGSGGWYIGGHFTVSGSTSRNLAHLLADGTLDPSWKATAYTASSSSNADTVYALAVSGSTVYVGGDVDYGKPFSCLFLCAFDSTGTNTSWKPEVNGPVRALAVSGSTVYAGGDFTSMAAITTTGSASTSSTALGLNAANAKIQVGTAVSGTGIAANTTVSAVSGTSVTLSKATTSVISSGYITFQGALRGHLAAIGTDGTLAPWNPNASVQTSPDTPTVNTLAVSGSTVYVGGTFDTIGSTTRNNLAAIGTDGTLAAWNPNVVTVNNSPSVRSLAVSGSTVYVGGNFSAISGSDRNNLAAIDSDGTATAWDPNPDAGVSALAVSGSTVYVGGDFSTIGTSASTPRSRLAAIGTDGTVDAA